MKLTRIVILAGVFVAPAAHAQISQILGVIHAAQNAVAQPAQGQPQQSGLDSTQDDQRLVAQAQAKQTAMQQQAQQQEQDDNASYRAQMEQKAAVGRQQAQQMVADQDAKDIAKYKESQQRDLQEAQQARAAANAVAATCPPLSNSSFNVAERFIRCRNAGLSEEKAMTVVAGLPLPAQTYVSAMVQDVYEDGVTDPRKGKAITDYYVGCMRRGSPCARAKW